MGKETAELLEALGPRAVARLHRGDKAASDSCNDSRADVEALRQITLANARKSHLPDYEAVKHILDGPAAVADLPEEEETEGPDAS